MANKVKANRRRGKNAERNVAKYLGGMNVGTLGGEDILCEDFSVEVKAKIRFAGEKILEQAERNNKRKVMPIGFIKIKNQPMDDSIVLLRAKDFKKLINGE